MTGRASEQLLDSIHGLLAGALKDELKAAIEASKPGPPTEEFPDGTPGVPINPKLLAEVGKFLVQNGINSAKSAPKVDALAKTLSELPDLDDEDLALNPRH